MRSTTGLLAADITYDTSAGDSAYRVRLRYDGNAPPQALIDALEAKGFAANGDSGHRIQRPLTEVVEDFSRPGTAPFGRWTPAECEAALSALRSMWDEFGLDFSPQQRPRSI